jgi:hypothetical protein
MSAPGSARSVTGTTVVATTSAVTRDARLARDRSGGHAELVDPKRLLVVSHSQTGGTRSLVDAFVVGARDDLIEGVEVVERDALEAAPADVLAADAIVLATPENFGYMSGALKYFFDHVYEPCREHTRGRPYALIIKARDDGQGALLSIERIVAGFAWRAARPPLIVVGAVTDADLEAATELGMTIAAELSLAAG